MKTMRRLLPLVSAGAALCLAGATAANAYSYKFINNTTATMTDAWLHTVSVFCHDVNWHGSVGPNGSVTIGTASICLVDEISINGGALYWSSPIGLASTTFTTCGSPPQLCPVLSGKKKLRRKAH